MPKNKQKDEIIKALDKAVEVLRNTNKTLQSVKDDIQKIANKRNYENIAIIVAVSAVLVSFLSLLWISIPMSPRVRHYLHYSSITGTVCPIKLTTTGEPFSIAFFNLGEEDTDVGFTIEGYNIQIRQKGVAGVYNNSKPYTSILPPTSEGASVVFEYNISILNESDGTAGISMWYHYYTYVWILPIEKLTDRLYLTGLPPNNFCEYRLNESTNEWELMN